MEPRNTFTVECDQVFEFIDDASRQREIPPRPVPVLSDEEKVFAKAISRRQCDCRRAALTWREIFEIVQSLGYRKVEQAAAPPVTPQANGNSQESACAGSPQAEMPS